MIFFPSRLSVVSKPAGLFLLLTLAGCVTGGADKTLLIPVLGGKERVRVEFTRAGPAFASGDGFKVEAAGFTINPAPKTPDLSFQLLVKDGAPPRRVTVEDISEETAQLFINDENPTLDQGHWRGKLPSVNIYDSRLAFLFRVNSDVRVFRFTIVAADGRTVVLNQASSYPPVIKSALRGAFGEKP